MEGVCPRLVTGDDTFCTATFSSPEREISCIPWKTAVNTWLALIVCPAEVNKINSFGDAVGKSFIQESLFSNILNIRVKTVDTFSGLNVSMDWNALYLLYFNPLTPKEPKTASFVRLLNGRSLCTTCDVIN